MSSKISICTSTLLILATFFWDLEASTFTNISKNKALLSNLQLSIIY